MDTLRELYKIGCGPSSSHTMGPQRAASKIRQQFPTATHFVLELRGSLAATGKGHLTDWIIIETLKPLPVEVLRMPRYVHPFHTNGMKFIAYAGEKLLGEEVIFSVGGGTIKTLADLTNEQEASPKAENADSTVHTYPHCSLASIMERCKENGKELWEYVEHCEGKEIWDYLQTIADMMEDAVQRGLNTIGLLP